MKQEKAKPITTGKAKSKQAGVKIVTPGNGEGPFVGIGTKVVDLETGKEILDIQEIHVHIVPDDVVRAEIIMFPSELEITAKRIKFRPDIFASRSRVLGFLRAQAPADVVEKFERVFPEGLVETTTLADRWRHFKRRITGQSKGDSDRC